MSGTDRLGDIHLRARRVLGEDAVTAPSRLWHPWALDLADDALLLLSLVRAEREARETAEQERDEANSLATEMHVRLAESITVTDAAVALAERHADTLRIIPPERLELLADWIDQVRPGSDDEVQRDLRALAAAALAVAGDEPPARCPACAAGEDGQ